MQFYVEQIAICNVTCTTTLFMMEAKGIFIVDDEGIVE
jgi:hypothetical protein